MALWMTFLLGRQAMFGQEPPTYFRSTTTVFIPFLARVQERSLPAAPLPRMSRSYSCALIADAALPLVAGLSKCSVVSMSFSCLVIRSAGLHTIKLLQSRNNIIRIKPAGVIHIHHAQRRLRDDLAAILRSSIIQFPRCFTHIPSIRHFGRVHKLI